MTDQPGWIKLAQGPDGAVLQAGGAWTVQHVADLDRQVASLPRERPAQALDLAEIEAIDTAGAWLLARATGQGERREVPWRNLPAEFQPLAQRVLTAGPKVVPDRPKARTLIDWVADIGEGVAAVLNDALNLIAFFGEFVLAAGRVILKPRRFRWTPLLVHIEQTGINALPIVGLISFLVGVVLAYQGAEQLRQFNAEFLTVNMVGISVLREMGASPPIIARRICSATWSDAASFRARMS